MGLRDTFLNMLGVETQEVQKVSNGAIRSARDFLKTGNRERLYPTWSDIKMPDSDMYRGYSYAVIQKRGNKVASLAKNNLKTYAKPEVVDEFQKRNETVWHPYLKLIEDSTEFTEKQFWKNISIYLDLAGRYYLGVIRNEIKPFDPKLPTVTTDPVKFIMLNPYEIRRVVDKDKQVAGYIERKKDGRYREWPLHQIIEMRELNPFDPENSQWAMTDAAREAVYTINQSSDYTRQSLNGNIDAPGIITTDVLLSDEDFANFRARVTQHTKGEPLFGNGTGAIKWDSMQIDLDKAALMDINEINRTELFAVSGTSKTSLGIEQSGTTRETARVQSEQFISDTAQPRLEDIVDFLNLDYKRHYNREYQKTGYSIDVESAVGKDYDTEQKATALKQSQFQLAMQLIQAGYTPESSYQFAEGEIDFADLELEKGLDKPKNPEEPEQPEDRGGNDNPTQPTNPKTPKAEEEEEETPEDLNGLEPHADLVEGENSLPLEVEEVHCTCEHDHKIETYINEVQEDSGKVVEEEYKNFLEEVRAIEKETINACARKVDINAFEQSDLIGKRKKASLIEKLKNAIHKYWWVIFPLFANEAIDKRNTEFGKAIKFIFNNELQAGVDDNALRVAEGHMNTILDDVLEASNRAYTNVLEEAAAELIIKVYDDSPTKWEQYFSHKPTMADALSSIRKTDILEKNRRIYEKANKMAFDGYRRGDIVKAIRAEYKDISENRAKLIARNETARAFGRSQFEADKQFLNGVGKITEAYKVWYSRRPLNEQDKICEFCNEMIRMSEENPIPFEQPFLAYGDSIEVYGNDGKLKIFTANYEDIDGGTLHPNCQCGYHLVFKNEAGEFIKTLNEGEKEIKNDTSNAVDTDSVDGGIDGDRNNNQTTKSINGGAGSGNFGHAGRPGQVGGSAKFGDKVAVSEQIASSKWLEEHREFLKSQGYTDAWIDDTLRLAKKQELIKKAYKAKTVKKFDEIVQKLKDENLYTDTWWEAAGKNTRLSIEAEEKRRELAQTPEQKEAIDNFLKTPNVVMKPTDEKWMRENVPEIMVKELQSEWNKAMAEGLVKETRIQFTTAISKQGSCTYELNEGRLLVRLTKGMMSNPERTLAKAKNSGIEGTRWWTCKPDQLGHVIRHELGHALAWQALINKGENTFSWDSFNGKMVNSAKKSYLGLKPDEPLYSTQRTPSQNVKATDLRLNKGYKHLSEYGNKNAAETVAESYCNPDYSEFTKNVYNELKKALKG